MGPSDSADSQDPAEDLLGRFLGEHPEGDLPEFDRWLKAQPRIDRPLAEQAVALLAVLRGVREWTDRGGSRSRRSGDLFGPDGPQRLAPDSGELARQQLEPGNTIAHFKLLEFVASGGMGQVFRAVDERSGQEVALKLLLPSRWHARGLALFAREAEAGLRQKHPNLVTTLDHGRTDEYFWIAQEFVPGAWTLRDFLEQSRNAPSLPANYYPRVARLIAAVASGLAAAHGAGVIHRDVKPANILIAPGDVPKLTDFGLARVVDDGFLSVSGDFAGTYAYMSPEQVTGKRMGLDHRTDIFSLGVVLYELLTLKRPFEGDTPHQVIARIVTEDPPEPLRIRSQCPEGLGLIALKALEKSPARRYASASEFAQDLQRHLDNQSVRAKPPGLKTRLERQLRRNPTGSAVVALVTIGLLVTSWLLVLNMRAGDRLRLANVELDGQRRQAVLAADALAVEKRRAIQERDRASAAEHEASGRAQELLELLQFLSESLGQIDPLEVGEQLAMGVESGFHKGKPPAGLSLKAVSSDAGALDATGLALEILSEHLLAPLARGLDSNQLAPAVRARLASELAFLCERWGFDDRALALYRRAHEDSRASLGPLARTTLTAKTDFGRALVHYGQDAEALRVLEETLLEQDQALGRGDPDSLLTRSLVGVLRAVSGDVSSGLELTREAVAGLERAVGPDDERRLEAESNLIATLQASGDLGGAMEWTERLLEREHHMGRDRSRELGLLSDFLALKYMRDGAIAVIEEHAELLLARRQALGREHPDTLRSEEDHAYLLLELERFDEVQAALRDLFTQQESLLRTGDLEAIAQRIQWGLRWLDAGRAPDSEACFRQALAALSQNPPGDLHELYRARRGLGSALLLQGRAAEALEFLEPFRSPEAEALDPALRSAGFEVLAACLIQLGRSADALPLLQTARAWRQEQGPLADPALQNTLALLGRALLDCDRSAEALPILEEAMASAIHLEGPGHPTVQALQVDLQRARQAVGQE